jgi:hypothetical protein
MNIETETRIPLSRANRHPLLKQGRRDGRPVHVATLWRWAGRGVRGVKLGTVRIGATVFTTAEEIERFVARLNGAADDAPAPVATRRAHAQADAELAAAGL